MASINITRAGNTHEKKGVCVMILAVTSAMYAELSAAGNYLVGYLPNKAVITDAFVLTEVVSDSGAVKVGTAEGGTEILSAGDTTALGASGTFTGKSSTKTGKPIFVSIAAPVTAGEFNVIIEYIELTKNTGELTQID